MHRQILLKFGKLLVRYVSPRLRNGHYPLLVTQIQDGAQS